MKIKATVRFRITALTWGNIQRLHIVSEIEDAKHQNKFLYCCIMVLIKTTISPFIRELAKQFQQPFECLGENTEKYIKCSVLIKKQNKRGKTVTFKLKFIDSVKFMPSLLSTLTNNLAEAPQKDKCKDCKSDVA